MPRRISRSSAAAINLTDQDLFSRTFQRLAGAPLGFDRDRVLLATITAPTVPGAERKALYHRLVRAASSVPGIEHAGGSLNPPLRGFWLGTFSSHRLVWPRRPTPKPSRKTWTSPATRSRRTGRPS